MCIAVKKTISAKIIIAIMSHIIYNIIMALEKDIRRSIKDFLKKTGWFVFPVFQGGMYSYPGISDYIAVRDGIVLFIEVKNERGNQSPDQKNFENNVNDHGGVYFVARSIEDVDNKIYELTGERSLMFA